MNLKASTTSLLLIFLSLASYGQLPPPVPAPAPPGLEAEMRRVYSEKSDGDLEDSLFEVLAEFLLSGDAALEEQTYWYLVKNERWLDLSSLEEVFLAYGKNHPESDMSLPSLNELHRSSRIERLAIYREALVTGSVRLRLGFLLSRRHALIEAVRDGMTEIASELEDHYKYDPTLLPNRVSIEYMLLTMNLRVGGEYRDDAVETAARKLLDIEGMHFRRRIKEDQVFRKVVFETLDYLCSRNPFDGSQLTGCQVMLDVYLRQAKIEDDRRENNKERKNSTNWLNPEMYITPEWLSFMENYRYGEISFQTHYVNRKYSGG